MNEITQAGEGYLNPRDSNTLRTSIGEIGFTIPRPTVSGSGDIPNFRVSSMKVDGEMPSAFLRSTERRVKESRIVSIKIISLRKTLTLNYFS